MILVANDFFISLEKCIWRFEQVKFLGYVRTLDRTEMGEDIIEAIKQWQATRSLRDLQSFLGFANFYRRFMIDFLSICRPLIESTKREKTDRGCTLEMERLFEELHNRFTTATILTHLNWWKTCIEETDASNFAQDAIL
jgi:hypothetical protein